MASKVIVASHFFLLERPPTAGRVIRSFFGSSLCGMGSVHCKARRGYVPIGSTAASLLPTALQYTDPTPIELSSSLKTFSVQRR